MSCCSNKNTSTVPPPSLVEQPALTTFSLPMASIAPSASLPPTQSPAQVAMLAELGPAGWIILAGLAGWWLFGSKR